MLKSANDLAERIHKLNKEASLEAIAKLMNELHISSGELVEYLNTKGSLIKSTSDRLREINQTRKKARLLKQQQSANLAKARATRAAKREERLSLANEIQEQQQSIQSSLSIDVDDSTFNLEELM